MTQFATAFAKIVDTLDQTKSRKCMVAEFTINSFMDSCQMIRKGLYFNSLQTQTANDMIWSNTLAFKSSAFLCPCGHCAHIHDIAEKSIPGKSIHKLFPAWFGHMQKLRYHILGSLRRRQITLFHWTHCRTSILSILQSLCGHLQRLRYHALTFIKKWRITLLN